MNNRQPSERQEMLENFLNALQDNDDDCSLYEPELMEFAEFEANGGFGEEDPRFEAIVAHLDRCHGRCNEEYAALVKALREYKHSSIQPTAIKFPNFFAKAATSQRPAAEPSVTRNHGSTILKIWEGIKRMLDLQLTNVILQPKMAVMADTTLYALQVTELAGQPFFVVNTKDADQSDTVMLIVVVRDVTGGSAWSVTLTVGASTRTQRTDSRGVAEFTTILKTDVASGVHIICEEQQV